MGCVASRLEEEEEQVVSICRERKHHLKLAVERRLLLAEAHSRYCQSLYAVSAAIKLFVARQSSPTSPFLITFPPPSCPPQRTEQDVKTEQKQNMLFLEQKQREHEAIACDVSCCEDESSTASLSESSEEEEAKEEVEREGKGLGYFYMQTPMQMSQSPGRDFGWDFFNPFESMRPEIVGRYRTSPDDDLKVVREQEGIPELEEEEEEGDRGEAEEQHEKVMFVAEENGNGECEESGIDVVKVVSEDVVDASQGEKRGLTVIDTPEEGRELLEALKDIEDHFIRAYDSGKDVSRMLEANRVYLQSGLEEIKENSTKLLSLAWHRSTLSNPSSCKSLVASSSKSSSTWTTEYKNDLFDDYAGMASGSHSLTLGRLYAWEKKLYKEVKAGDNMQKIYERKCSRLRNQDIRGDEHTMDKARAAVKDLYARILVAIRCAESISKRIEKLRDEELQPQIIELLKGLSRTWKIMLESHETQKKILLEVKFFACPTHGKFCNDSHRLATLQLEAELQNWRACFIQYVSSQKAYIEALHGWLTKFLVPEVEFYSRGRTSAAPPQAKGPPLLVICRDWLSSIEKLSDNAVSFALKSFSKDVKALWAQQGEEQQQKRKVDSLAKELDKRTLAFQRAESRFVESKLIEYQPDPDAENRSEHLIEKQEQLDTFRKKLDLEREKHRNCIQETHSITLNGFQTGFGLVFESLTEFSKVSMKMYNDLVNYSEIVGKMENQSYIEDSKVEENGSR